MKILRMTGMALVVILMSVHFVACNDDNDDDDDNNSNYLYFSCYFTMHQLELFNQFDFWWA